MDFVFLVVSFSKYHNSHKIWRSNVNNGYALSKKLKMHNIFENKVARVLPYSRYEEKCWSIMNTVLN